MIRNTKSVIDIWKRFRVEKRPTESIFKPKFLKVQR